MQEKVDKQTTKMDGLVGAVIWWCYGDFDDPPYGVSGSVVRHDQDSC